MEGLEEFEASDSSYESITKSNYSFEPKQHFKEQVAEYEGIDDFNKFVNML